MPRTIISSTAGYVVAAVGWSKFFVVTFFAAMPGLLLLVILRPLVNELEARDAATGVRDAAREKEIEGDPAD